MRLIYETKESIPKTYVYEYIENIIKKYKCEMTHSCGFFSCCTVWLLHLMEIVRHLNNKNISIDTTKSFMIYKNKDNQGDIAHKYFTTDYKDKDIPIIDKSMNLISYIVYFPYKNLDLKSFTPYVDKYFTPSDSIKKIIINMEKKYKIDYDNTCCVFYRGLDKFVDTHLPSYNEFCNKAIEITKKHKNIKYLLQSDETNFLHYAANILTNYFIFDDEIRHVNKEKIEGCALGTGILEFCLDKEENFKYSEFFLSIVIIMSKCKYVVCNSSNISFWISLFRGNTTNLHQHLKQLPRLCNNTIDNKFYNRNITDSWY
jgi:hypothetical protein